ncbi:MAG: Na/Pi cotransporter family protein, partial [Bacteroidia bacterium]|nr:Na/Pi cotransporter family protein [Bacteroidia bacterium]
KQEVLRMSLIVQEIVKDIIPALIAKDKKIIEAIAGKEKEVDFLRDNIKDYLVAITHQNIHQEQVNEAFQMMYTVKELEQIADIVTTNIYHHAVKWAESDIDFSEAGKKEIYDYHIKVLKQISRAIEVFRDVNLEKARAMKEKYKEYADMAREFERHHFERLLADIDKSIASSKVHLEIIDLLRVISSHSTNIARILLEWSDDMKGM